MLSMSVVEPPKFPFSNPDEIKAASEKAMNFWVGALSPMWVPFWAATSFGVGAWAVAQSLSKSGSLVKDLPQLGDLPAKWPGFTSWGKATLLTAESAGISAEAPADMVKPIEAALKAEAAVVEKAVDVVTETVADTVAAAEPVVEKATKAVADTVKASVDTKPLIDPVTETLVVPAVAEAIAEVTPPAAKVVEAVAKPAVEAVAEAAPKVAKAAVEVPAAAAKAVETVTKPAVEAVVEAAPKVAKAAAEAPVAAVKAVETVTKPAVEAVAEDAPKVAKAATDPAPVVKAAAATTAPVAKAAEAVVKATAPKMIAKDLAVAKPEAPAVSAPKTKTPKV